MQCTLQFSLLSISESVEQNIQKKKLYITWIYKLASKQKKNEQKKTWHTDEFRRKKKTSLSHTHRFEYNVRVAKQEKKINWHCNNLAKEKG